MRARDRGEVTDLVEELSKFRKEDKQLNTLDCNYNPILKDGNGQKVRGCVCLTCGCRRSEGERVRRKRTRVESREKEEGLQ